MRTVSPAHPGTRLSLAADVVGRVRRDRAGGRDLSGASKGRRRGSAPHFTGRRWVISARHKGGALRKGRGCQRLQESLHTLLQQKTKYLENKRMPNGESPLAPPESHAKGWNSESLTASGSFLQHQTASWQASG
nr:unnamed protein product [Rangifer tarandus platyrhynchus]